MRQFAKWLPALLAALVLLTVPALAADGEVTVTDAAGFRAALENEDVQTIRFSGVIRLAPDQTGAPLRLNAGMKTILPLHPDSDEDNLIFEPGVTMLHISRHEGNRENPETQSIRLIYGRDYDGKGKEPDLNLLAEAAEGWVGWYEYHGGTDTEQDEHAGHRLCYLLYCGTWQAAVNCAQDLTWGNWEHTPTASAGDDNQIVFFQFGKPRNGNEILIEQDVTVTGWTQALGGQNLTVKQGATLTTAVLELETMGGEWGYKGPGKSCLTTTNGGSTTEPKGRVYIHKPEGSYAQEAALRAEGSIDPGYFLDGIQADKDAEVFCEYHPLGFSKSPIKTGEGELKRSPEAWGLTEESTAVPADGVTGYAYGFSFERNPETGKFGWRPAPEGAETLLVTDAEGKPSRGVISCDAGDGKVFLLPLAAGEYRLYLYHNPDDFRDEWGDWTPTGYGTDVPGTEGAPAVLTSAGAYQPGAYIMNPLEDGRIPVDIELPREAMVLAERVLSVPGAEGGSPDFGELFSWEEDGVTYKEALFPKDWGWEWGWRILLLDGELRPLVPAMTLGD